MKLEAEANSEPTNFIRSWKWKQKIFYCFHIPGANIIVLIKKLPRISYPKYFSKNLTLQGNFFLLRDVKVPQGRKRVKRK